MARQWETLSVLVAVEFIVVAGVLFVLVPFEVAAPVVPLCLVLLVALYLYRS
jgi:hypothetical protein